MATSTALGDPPSDVVGGRFVELSERLRQEAALSGDELLARRLLAFLDQYRQGPQVLPRSPIERLTAQRLLRQLLIARRCYGVVYGWYEAFKAPYGEDFEANLRLYVQHLRAAADGFGWIRGRGTVLECGCGAESLGLVLARHNRRWIGSDIYVPEALERLKAIFDPVGPFEFQVIDGVTLDGVADRSVDVVVSRSFFEHLLVDDALQHLRQAHRVLAAGGQFVCLCPAGIGPPSDVTQEFPEFDTPQGLHIKEYRVAELTRELKAAGFARVRSRFIRVRGLGRLPAALNARNEVPPAVAAIVESMAQSTWPVARRSAAGRTLWKKAWGHVGATPLLVVATRD
ncbi:MAG: class I SAM-dependent methyltransferase [Vicinamibacterales bacterium]